MVDDDKGDGSEDEEAGKLMRGIVDEDEDEDKDDGSEDEEAGKLGGWRMMRWK